MAKHTLNVVRDEHVWTFFKIMHERVKMMTSLKIILKVKLYIPSYWEKHFKYV